MPRPRKMNSGMAGCPKLEDGKNYSWLDLLDVMYKGEIKGFFAWGQNPACSGANSNKTRDSAGQAGLAGECQPLRQRDRILLEGSGSGSRRRSRPKCLCSPARRSWKKRGRMSNSGRWAQWRYKAQNPAGGSQCPTATSWWSSLMKSRPCMKKEKKGAFQEADFQTEMGYMKDGKFDPHAVAKAINGYFTKDVTLTTRPSPKGSRFRSFADAIGRRLHVQRMLGLLPELQRTTATTWRAATRRTRAASGSYSKWAWAWPVNRRIIYNRACGGS